MFYHHSLCEGAGGFAIGAVRASIAYVGEGESDGLPVVGRVGHDFLVARHGGVKAQFCGNYALRAKPRAIKERAVR